MKTAGIDIGTTSLSLVITESPGNRLLGSRTIPHQAFLKPSEPFHRIQDPERLFLLVCEALRDLIRDFGPPQAIGLTGQMHGILYVDASGKAVSPLFTWQDTCGSIPLADGTCSTDLLRRAGLPVSSGYGLATHFYLQLKNLIPENAVSFVTISDYIAMRLTGTAKAFAASDMAASFGCLNVKTGSYLLQELKQAGADAAFLPELHQKHDLIGQTSSMLDGIPADIPVFSSLGDHQASVFGAVNHLDGVLLLNIGTGSQCSMQIPAYTECSGSLEVRPFLFGQYLLTGSGLCGGRAYALLEQFYRSVADGCCAPATDSGFLAGRGSITDGRSSVLDTSHLYAWMEHSAETFLKNQEKATAWRIETGFAGKRSDPSAAGSMRGITTDNFTPGAMTAGMIIGILEELREMYVEMKNVSDIKVERLIGSGNGLRQNKLMQQLAEEVFELPLQMSEAREEAACGAAMLAALSV